MDSPVCTFRGDDESGSEGEACATEGEEIVAIVCGEDERDAETEVPEPFACRDGDNDTDDNAVDVSLLNSM